MLVLSVVLILLAFVGLLREAYQAGLRDGERRGWIKYHEAFKAIVRKYDE